MGLTSNYSPHKTSYLGGKAAARCRQEKVPNGPDQPIPGRTINPFSTLIFLRLG